MRDRSNAPVPEGDKLQKILLGNGPGKELARLEGLVDDAGRVEHRAVVDGHGGVGAERRERKVALVDKHLVVRLEGELGIEDALIKVHALTGGVKR